MAPNTVVRVEWSNPPPASWLKFGGPLEATIVRAAVAGRARRRKVGARARLTLDEAAAVLGRPRAYVERAVRTGFLRPVRGSRRHVTLRACVRFLQEEEHDGRIASEREGEPTIPAEEVYRALGI
jgi:hypothetical protein